MKRAAVALCCLIATWQAPARAQDQPRFDDKGRPVDEPQDPPAERKITLPSPKGYVAPDYPPEAKAAGIEGEVVLKLTIDEDGKVIDAVVDRGAGHGFDEAAVAAAYKQPFEPARYADGNPFKAIIKYRYRFTLDEQVDDAAPEVGTFSGRLLVQGVEAPLAGASITLEPVDGGELRSLRSDAAGRFDFGELPPGDYRVIIEAPGYSELALTETIAAGGAVDATYRIHILEQAGVFEVFVEEEKPPREVVKRTITKREIERIPGTGGDALRSIQSLPGVARTPGGLGALIVRGSSPFDTLTFVDGVFVPLIYHFGGLSSVIPTELLSKIDFYPGNFSARYGRAMGGIVDAGIRSPSDEYHGLLQLDLIDARLMLEGPVPNLDGWTFAAAGRRSWIDAWLGPVLEEAGAGVTQAPRYYDYQFLLERKWDDGQLRASFYGSDDRLELIVGEPAPGEPALSGNVGLVTVFQRAQLGLAQQLSDDHHFDMQLALSRDALSFGLASLFFDLESFGVMGRAEHTIRLAKSAQMHWGIDMQVGTANVRARIPEPPRPGQPPNQPFSTRNVVAIDQQEGFFRPATYLEFEVSPLSRWRLVPGLRLDYALDTEKWDASPRFNTRFDVVEGFPRTTLKGGIGVFHQPPQFQQSVPPLGQEGIGSNLAVHYGLGAEQEITRQLEASVEGFYKQLDNLVVVETSDSGAYADYSNDALGNVVGMEVLVKYKPDDRFFGWLAYTLSRSVRQNSPSEDEYPVLWDQTHVLTVLGSYRFGGGWEVGARFRLVSGNLFTPNVCNPAEQSCDPNRINALYHAASGAYTPIRFGTLNNERLPLFHSLDVRVDKAWQFAAWKLSAYLDVQNAYNSPSPEGVVYNFNFTNRQYVTGIPILPSIGLRGEF